MKTGSRILVIDDNEDFRLALIHVLSSKGHKVYEAGNGLQGLELMNTVTPDLAIVDLDMPKMNGIDFSRRVKSTAPDFPIMMVTAYAQFYSPTDIKSAGVDAFMHKPVDWDQFEVEVDRLLAA